MQQPNEPVYFIHLSDTHIGPTRSYERHGFLSWPAAQRAIEVIDSFPFRPDFIIHTGDVVTDPNHVAYQLAAELMNRLNLPLYFAVGNHDTAAAIKKYLPHGPYEPLVEDPGRHAYSFWVKGWEFIVLDGRAPDELDPQGLLGEEQLGRLQQRLDLDLPNPLVVFVHFPALPLNSPWFDREMLLIDGHQLHKALLSSRRPVRGVFHGHIHMPLHTFRDGILYSAAPSTFANFAAWPDREEPQFLDEHPGFAFVQLLPDQTLIRYHGFERPEPPR